jgi:hypothetical protein
MLAWRVGSGIRVTEESCVHNGDADYTISVKLEGAGTT